MQDNLDSLFERLIRLRETVHGSVKVCVQVETADGMRLFPASLIGCTDVVPEGSHFRSLTGNDLDAVRVIVIKSLHSSIR